MGEFIAIPVALVSTVLLIIGGAISVDIGKKDKKTALKGAGIATFATILIFGAAIVVAFFEAVGETGKDVFKDAL